jgi:hypothetical protein
MSLFELCQWIEATRIGVYVREDLWAFPVLIAVHMLGLTLSVGTLLWFDLRLMGFGVRNCSVSRLYRRLMPLMLPSFLVMTISGVMIFVGFATLAYENTYFRIKLIALIVAGLNAMIFHLVTEKRIAQWDEQRVLPFSARVAGFVSILAWLTVILAGRMISYTMYGAS